MGVNAGTDIIAMIQVLPISVFDYAITTCVPKWGRSALCAYYKLVVTYVSPILIHLYHFNNSTIMSRIQLHQSNSDAPAVMVC